MGYFSRGEQVVVLLLVAALLVGCGVLSWQALGRPEAAVAAGAAGSLPGAPGTLVAPASGGGDGGQAAGAGAVPKSLVVHVCGAVARPGVYRLPAGSRVADALQAAGGAVAGAARDALNLAATLRDGQKVEVPSARAISPPRGGGASGGGGTAAGSSTPPARPTPDDPLDLNSAGQSELDALPGIGPALAARVIQYREEHGPFARVEDLLRVSGIGPKTLEGIRALVRVE